MVKGLVTGLIASLFGIIGGLFYFEMNERKLEQQMIEQLKIEVVELKKTNSHLIMELIQVQAITGAYDTDAKFIESVEGYTGMLGRQLNDVK